MPITTSQGPANGTAIVGRAVANLMNSGPGALPPVGGAAAPAAAEPMQLFMVRLDDIANRNFLKKAVPIGWRYLIYSGGPIEVADIKQKEGENEATFSSLIRGEIAKRLFAAAKIAGEHYEFDQDKYETRVLEIPSLYIVAFWLHGPKEIFIPFLDGAQRDKSNIQEDPSFLSRVVKSAAMRR